MNDCAVQFHFATANHRQKAATLWMDYAVHETPFGKAVIAMAEQGICAFAFLDDHPVELFLESLQKKWPAAILQENNRHTASVIQTLFKTDPGSGFPRAGTEPALTVYVSGTEFQIRVWKALLQIPYGKLASYARIATAIGQPRSARAVGLAVGANPVAVLIPCHRVIHQNGQLGGYRWGVNRKRALQAWEMAGASDRAGYQTDTLKMMS